MLTNPKEDVMRYEKGFNLIELMVVVAIVGILAAVAMPAYNDYVRRGKLTEAMTILAGMRVKLEQYYQDKRTYVGGCAAGTVAPLPTADETKYFTYTCPVLTDTAFEVDAVGIAAVGTDGFTYTINQNNAKTSVITAPGWTGNATCWARKKDGSC